MTAVCQLLLWWVIGVMAYAPIAANRVIAVLLHPCNTADSFRKLIRDDCWQQNVDTRNGNPTKIVPTISSGKLMIRR